MYQYQRVKMETQIDETYYLTLIPNGQSEKFYQAEYSWWFTIAFQKVIVALHPSPASINQRLLHTLARSATATQLFVRFLKQFYRLCLPSIFCMYMHVSQCILRLHYINSSVALPSVLAFPIFVYYISTNNYLGGSSVHNHINLRYLKLAQLIFSISDCQITRVLQY